MSSNAMIELRSVYLRMGRRVHEEVLAAELTPDPQVVSHGEYLLVLTWPREYRWLAVAIDTVTDRGEVVESWVGHAQSPEVFEELLGRVGTTSQVLLCGRDPDYLRRYSALACVVSRARRYRVRVEVDTHSRDLARLAALERDRVPPSDVLRVLLRGIACTFKTDPPQIARLELSLHLKPLTPIAPFRGCVALDLGNFSSTIAALREGGTRSSEIMVLDGQPTAPALRPQAPTIDSLVRVDRVKSWCASRAEAGLDDVRLFPNPARYPTDDFPAAIDWVVGSPAGDGNPAQQVPGAKRLLASFNPDATRSLQVDHVRYLREEGTSETRNEPIRVPNRLAAELLAARLLQLFVQATRPEQIGVAPAGWPLFLAVTYPTSYSPREINQLRLAVYRAWLRALSHAQSEPTAEFAPDPDIPEERARVVAGLQRYLSRQGPAAQPYDPREDVLVRMMIDEATAASFYYLFRFSAEAPGGLSAFRYKYPGGMNLLIYDCGGGTTDIALVSGRVDGDRSNRLNVAVLGRSGVRNFGGDDITIAVCRVLKAKLVALILKKTSRPAANPPVRPEGASGAAQTLAEAREMERFFRDCQAADPGDLLGTRFDPLDTSRGTVEARRRALTLWGWGEELKRKLCVPGPDRAFPASIRFSEISQRIQPGLGGLYKAIYDCFGNNLLPPRIKEIEADLGKIEVHRWEVDALIARQVARSLACCRSLIESAREPATTPAVVHKLVVTGNAARYPMIQEALLERLQVNGLPRESWYHFEEGELKNAVAKGAVRALQAKKGEGQTKFDFDTNFAECLPYDIAYRDWANNSFPRLYRVQDRYAHLPERTVPMVALQGSARGEATLLSTFDLLRRFPGDGEEVALEEEDLPGFDAEAELRELRELRGYTSFATYFFRDGITGDLKIRYDAEAHDFVVRDSNGNEGERRPSEGMELRSLAPHQRGNL